MRHAMQDCRPGSERTRTDAGSPAWQGRRIGHGASDRAAGRDLVCEACGTVLIPDYWVLAEAVPGPMLSGVELACPACRAVSHPE